HRDVSAEDDGVVKGLEVVLCAESLLSHLALTVDLTVTHFVAAGLSRPRAVAIDFAGHLKWVRSVYIDEKLHTLISRPFLWVNTGIDDKATGAECDRLQIAEASEEVVVIGTEFICELFGVESPSF